MGDPKLSLNICLGSASVELALKKLVEDGTLKRIGTGQRLIMLMLMHMRNMVYMVSQRLLLKRHMMENLQRSETMSMSSLMGNGLI